MTGSLPELLAPAGSPEALAAAIRCGADAVYLGGPQFSARAHAENFDSDSLAAAAALCHRSGVKKYPAVNTLLFDREFAALDRMLCLFSEIGADGIIVQDAGVAAYIRRRLPTLRLHASTQMTIHTPAGIRYAAEAGFCRVVAARELSAEQLRAVCAEARRGGGEVEMFVHGAHCMSVSGQCWMSAAMGGRSANRGCCAQPCRLPFTADASQPDACALSLKDLCLLDHLRTVQEIGVRSLKIEGRMKRPEYVAAAVTAYREALSGREPDRNSLQAVFSRSGFTDGYFTGKRTEMFGTRRKEDVLAAQDVLRKLGQLYQKPRKCAVLDAHFVLREGEPSVLTVSDGICSVTVTGAVPQKALNLPTDLAHLEKQFDRLGDSIYLAGDVTAEIGDGLMLTASALNALRRDAVSAMDAARTEAFTPIHALSEIPACPEPARYSQTPSFRVQLRNAEQLSAVLPFADRLESVLIPLKLALAGEIALPKEKCIIVPPRLILDEPEIEKQLLAAKKRGYSEILCQSAGDLPLGVKCGLHLHGCLGLHLTNGFAAEEYAARGLRDLLVSPELPLPCSVKSSVPLGAFVYGRLPLMLTRNCPVRAQVGCSACRHCLTDRKGCAVYVDCTRYTDSPDYAELFNASVHWLADRPKTNAGCDYGLLFMTDESGARVREVLSAYLDGAAVSPPESFTRGIRLQSAEQPVAEGIAPR